MRLLRRNLILVTTILASLLLGAVVRFTAVQTHVTATILLGFSRMAEGKYPNGSYFDPSDITADSVLAEAARELAVTGLQLTPASIRPHLSITGTGGIAVTEAAVTAPTKGRDTRSYLPSTYTIRLVRGNELGLSLTQQEQLLGAIVTAFTRYAEARARPAISTALPDFGDIASYDFPYIPLLLQYQIDHIAVLIDANAQNSGTWRSPISGLSYVGVIGEIERLRSQLGSVRELIARSGLTRDRETSLRRYEAALERLESSRLRDQEIITLARNLLADADRDTPRPPGPVSSASVVQGENNIVEILVKQDYRTDLLQRVVDAGRSMRDTEGAIAEVRAQVAALQAANLSPSDQAVAAAQVQQQLKDIQERLAGYVKTANALRDEQEAGGAGDGHVLVLSKPTVITVLQPWRDLVQFYGIFGLLLGIGAQALSAIVHGMRESRKGSSRSSLEVRHG